MVANVVAHCEDNSCVAVARGSVCRVSLLRNAGRKPPHASEIFVTISPHELEEQACIVDKERRVLPSCDTPPVCEAGARLRVSAGGFFFHFLLRVLSSRNHQHGAFEYSYAIDP